MLIIVQIWSSSIFLPFFTRFVLWLCQILPFKLPSSLDFYTIFSSLKAFFSLLSCFLMLCVCVSLTHSDDGEDQPTMLCLNFWSDKVLGEASRNVLRSKVRKVIRKIKGEFQVKQPLLTCRNNQIIFICLGFQSSVSPSPIL